MHVDTLRMHVPVRAPPGAVRMQLLGVDTLEQLESLLAVEGDGILVINWSDSAFVLGNSVVSRVAATYAASRLYGGVSCAAVTILMDFEAGELMATLRGVATCPRIEIWQRGLVRKTDSASLEAALLALGVRSASNKFNKPGFGSELGSGLPSPTAVDEMDFTGGAGGKPLLGSGPDRGTTADYFPTTLDEFEREQGKRDMDQF